MSLFDEAYTAEAEAAAEAAPEPAAPGAEDYETGYRFSMPDLSFLAAPTGEGAIDDYIEYCKTNNLPLHKSYSGTFNVRISPELHAKIAMSAHSLGISLNAYIQKVLTTTIL